MTIGRSATPSKREDPMETERIEAENSRTEGRRKLTGEKNRGAAEQLLADFENEMNAREECAAPDDWIDEARACLINKLTALLDEREQRAMAGEPTDQPSAWMIVDHRNATALITTDVDRARHVEASEHHRVDPLYLRPAPDPLGLAARVVALESLKDALAKWEQWWYEDVDGWMYCEFCGSRHGEEVDSIEHAAGCPRDILESLLASPSPPAVQAVREIVDAAFEHEKQSELWQQELERSSVSEMMCGLRYHLLASAKDRLTKAVTDALANVPVLAAGVKEKS